MHVSDLVNAPLLKEIRFAVYLLAQHSSETTFNCKDGSTHLEDRLRWLREVRGRMVDGTSES